MIKDANSIFDDYSMSPKIRQILLHWGYDCLKVICYYLFLIFLLIQKQAIIGSINNKFLQKAKEKYDNGGKEKTAKYYQANKDSR